MGSVAFPIEAILWIVAFFIQIAGTVVAIGMWSSKLTIRVEALEKRAEEHSGLALAVERLETTLNRAVKDLEEIMNRRPEHQATPSLAGIPPDILARAFVEMARGKNT